LGIYVAVSIPAGRIIVLIIRLIDVRPAPRD
jgi:hypothetical protein